MQQGTAKARLVLGVGNILLRDEGVGVHVVRALEDRPLPADVELLDGGTAALDLLNAIADRKKVIVVDAVRGGGEPGDIYRFHPEDAPPEAAQSVSLHQVDLLETLTSAELLGCAPQEVVIFGIEPKELDWGLDLSPEVAAVVPRVIELVLTEIGGQIA